MNKKIYIPIEDHPDLVRDYTTGMIININKEKAIQSRRIREQKLKERQEVDTLKADVSDIKRMLQQLLENKHNA
jgi:hypothetical protein